MNIPGLLVARIGSLGSLNLLCGKQFENVMTCVVNRIAKLPVHFFQSAILFEKRLPVPSQTIMSNGKITNGAYVFIKDSKLESAAGFEPDEEPLHPNAAERHANLIRDDRSRVCHYAA